MLESDETKELTGLARSIDALFRERATPQGSEPTVESEAGEAVVPPPLPETEAVTPPPLPVETSPDLPVEAAAPPPLPEELPPIPLPVEASPPPLPEEVSPPPLPVEASAPPLPEEASPPPLPVEASVPPLPAEVSPPAPDAEVTREPAAEPDVAETDPLTPVQVAEAMDESEEEPPTELDLAVDAYLEGDRGRASEIERLAAEMLEERHVGPVARSVGRLAASAGDPPESAPLDLARGLSSPVVLGRLARMMGRERDEEQRRENYRACRVLGADMARAIRDDLAENTEALARHVHCEALVEMGPAGREVIEEMAQDDIWFLARNGVAILGDVGGDHAVELVTGALANPDARVRREALRSLAKLHAPDAGELVVGLMDDSDEDVQIAAAVAAGELHVDRAVKPLIAMLEGTKDPDRIIPIVRALGQLEDPGAVPSIEKHAVPSLFSKPRTDVRIAAYRALYHIGTPHAIKLLAKASSDKDAEVQAAVLSLRRKPEPEPGAEG